MSEQPRKGPEDDAGDAARSDDDSSADDSGAVLTSNEEAPRPRLSPKRLLGRRVAQVLFFGTVVWIILSFSVQVVGDALFRPRVAHDVITCRAQIGRLHARLDAAAGARDAQDPPEGETAAVLAFRAALSLDPQAHDRARSWDDLAFELVDGCPAVEANIAYALGRLRATQEAMVRIDAFDEAPARRAFRKANEPLKGVAPHEAIPDLTQH